MAKKKSKPKRPSPKRPKPGRASPKRSKAKRVRLESKIRCAAIGLGMGRHHAKAFAEDGRTELVAVCDLDTSRCDRIIHENDWSGVRCYTDYKRMLKVEKPAAVSVALPNFLHSPVSVDCLNSGAHVICEKPMAMNVRECERMIRAARRHDRQLMINFSYRYMPQSRFLKGLVDEGRLGKVYYARTGWHRRRGIPGLGGWFTTKKLSGGGPLIDLGVHRIDLAWWLMGSPDPVTVSASTYSVFGPRMAKERGGTFTVEDLAAGIVRFRNGSTLLIEVSWASNSGERERMFTELYGDAGGARQVNLEEGYKFRTEYFTEMGGSQVNVEQHSAGSFAEGGAKHLISCVAEGTQVDSSGEDGLAIQKILDGMYRSAELGREVKIR